jgi:hypothetical protein
MIALSIYTLTEENAKYFKLEEEPLYKYVYCIESKQDLFCHREDSSTCDFLPFYYDGNLNNEKGRISINDNTSSSIEDENLDTPYDENLNNFIINAGSKEENCNTNSLINKNRIMLLEKLNNEFLKFHSTQKISESVHAAFDIVSNEIASLPIEDSYIEYIESEKLLNFSLAFNKGLIITLGKTVNGGNEVLFSISHLNEIIAVNKMDLYELVPCIKNMIHELA